MPMPLGDSAKSNRYIFGFKESWCMMGLYFLACAVSLEVTRVCGWFWDNDVYYIIALGRSIWREGIPFTDPLLMHGDLTCVAQQWLFSVAIAAFYDRWGRGAVEAALALVWLGSFLCILALCRDQDEGLTPLCFLWAGAACLFLSPFVKTNPRCLDVLSLCVCSLTCSRYLKGGNPSLLAVPPIVSIIMANCHLSMWPLAVMPVACSLLDERAKGRRLPLATCFATGSLASLINPYGLQGSWYVFASLGTDGLFSLGIQELQPAALQFDFPFVVAVFLAPLVWCFCLGRVSSLRRRGTFLDIAFVGLWVAALLHLRNTLLFLPLAAATLTRLGSQLGWFSDWSREDTQLSQRRWERCFVSLSTFLLTGLICFAATGNEKNADTSLVKAVDALAEAGLPLGSAVGNLFDAGGYLEVKGYRPFSDERAELLDEDVNGCIDLAGEIGLVASDQESLAQWIDSYGFPGIVIGSNLMTWHTYEDLIGAGYTIVYEDGRYLAAISSESK